MSTSSATVAVQVGCGPVVPGDVTATGRVDVDVTCGPDCACHAPYDPWIPEPPAEQACIEEQPPQRVVLTSMHVLHTRWGVDSRCFSIKIERILRMPVICDLKEYRYCWPQGCAFTVLPPGTYEISIPAQSAYPLEIGTEIDLEVILEPVGHEFLEAVQTNNGTNTNGCCGC